MIKFEQSTYISVRNKLLGESSYPFSMSVFWNAHVNVLAPFLVMAYLQIKSRNNVKKRNDILATHQRFIHTSMHSTLQILVVLIALKYHS